MRALPFLQQGAKTLGRAALKTGLNIARDVLTGKNVGDSARSRVRQTAQTLKEQALALSTFVNPLKIFCRYVDDIIAMLKKSDIRRFHQHLNNQDDNIKFTLERYSEEGLPFLDTLCKVQSDGKVVTSVYRKKTHTDRYLDFNSHHPNQHKASVVRTLLMLFHRPMPTNSQKKNT